MRGMKGAVSAQKALQVSETDTRQLLGGTEEKTVSLIGSIDLPSGQINDILPVTCLPP